jgi:hypothetical protein
MFADLGRLIHCTDNRYSHNHIKSMVYMMLSGLEYIHSSGIMHQVCEKSFSFSMINLFLKIKGY